MQIWSKIAGYLFNGFTLILASTLLLTGLAFQFYLDREQRESSKRLEPLRRLDYFTYDLRLRARGPRSGSDQVALLAIDEHAVRSIGRWPWPRERVAFAMEKALEHGARIVAWDITFSEASDQPGRRLLDEMERVSPLSPQQKIATESILLRQDSDRILGDAIERHADKNVLGIFANFEDPYVADPSYRGYHQLCFGWIQQMSPQKELWDRDSVLVAAILPQTELPETIQASYRFYLQQMEDEIRKSNPVPRNSTERVALDGLIERQKSDFCLRFLDAEHDPVFPLLRESWDAIREQEITLKDVPFDNWVQSVKSSLPVPRVPAKTDWVLNIPELTLRAKHFASFSAELDLDGQIRRKSLISRTGSRFIPSLGLKAYLVSRDYNASLAFDIDTGGEQSPSTQENLTSARVSRFEITDNQSGDRVFDVPVDAEGQLLLNYAGPQKMFPHVSMAELFTDNPKMTITRRERVDGEWVERENEVDKSAFFKDKILVVGATATGIYDLRVTPFEKNYPGPETHLTVIDNLLRQDFLRSHPLEKRAMPLAVFALGLLSGLLLLRWGAVAGFAVAILSVGLILILEKMLFFDRGIVISVMFPVATVGWNFVQINFYKYMTEARKKREIKGTFSKYVSPAIVDEILRDPSNIELGGQKKMMTVFFSDVRGFTTLSEKLDPRALADLLNKYLTPMTAIVFKNKGTLDKYIGDAVMAFFGAPVEYPDHAHWACRCALESLEQLNELRGEFQARGLPDIDIGIGINTGEMSVGNMGSETVRNYTVMGDAVNLGSRLEGITKQYGVRVIVSESTYAAVKDTFVCREIDRVRVKGKYEPVRIYELLGEQKVPAAALDLVKRFERGYGLYHAKKWDEAIAAFSLALDGHPDDMPSQLYVQRCQEYIQSPPPDSWDGVYIMTSK